jgi:nitrogen fixation/metabolism regulation signal transduction histidine kinase
LPCRLLALISWQLRSLWGEHQAKVFGSRLKLRLMLMFGLMAVLPGVLIYAVSVQFVTKSIETWFDVRVEKALEAGLNLGRSALDSLLEDLAAKAQTMALELGERSETQRRLDLNRLREQYGLQSAALFATNGELLATATGELATLMPKQPAGDELRRVLSERRVALLESDGEKDLSLRVLVAVTPPGLGGETRILQLSDPVPAALALNADSVQTVYADYQELSLGREGLTRIYAMTLTLTVLLALFTAIALAFVLARRLSAPLSILAEGTQAVTAGDYTPRQEVYSGDELGVLTRSFKQMTSQLDDARRDNERQRAELEAARAYLESILANLSAGVLVFDARFVLRTVNEGALTILADDFSALLGVAAADWPRQQDARRGHSRCLCRTRQQRMAGTDRARCAGQPAAADPAAARHQTAGRITGWLRGGVRRRDAADCRSAQCRLGRSRAPIGTRNQESADADPALGRALADEAG